MPNLYIYRGLPGSGKTTEANKLGCIVLSPWDMFITRDGKYKWPSAADFEDTRLNKIHWVKNILRTCVEDGIDIAVAETLVQHSMVFDLYNDVLNMQMVGMEYRLIVVDCICTVEESLHRNVHNVPEDVIQNMARLWEPWDIKENPLLDAAYHFYRGLPDTIPKPEMTVEYDGGVNFDWGWNSDSFKRLSFTVYKKKTVAYAWINNGNSGHGVFKKFISDRRAIYNFIEKFLLHGTI